MANLHTGLLRVKSVLIPLAATVVKAETLLFSRAVVPLSVTFPAAPCVWGLSAAHCEQ